MRPSQLSLNRAMENSDRDAVYKVDDEKLQEIRNQKIWQIDPKYFIRVSVSPSAVMKMLIHANSGVEKGIASVGRKPVEVMGLILGRPSTDPKNLDTLIVTDVFPLPIEGAETKVLADDEEVINYMISLGESLEITRKERFMGWYHSHPFDVDVQSHCFLSATDVSTQLQWQRAEDPHGNPWLAIVIDPLRSLAKGRPEMQSFRVYPPEYTAPLNETPDGKIISDESQRLERWGSCWNRYYQLEMDYFLSSLGSKLMGILSEQFLWMRTLSATPMLERENRQRLSERISTLSRKLDACDISLRTSRGSYVQSTFMSDQSTNTSTNGEDSAMTKCTKNACELAIEQCQGQTTQIAKNTLFNTLQ